MTELTRALVIRETWIDKILSGGKNWEMRSKPTNVRGTIGLVRAGSGLVVGVADLVSSLPALNAVNYALHEGNHAIPKAMIDGVLENGWVYPWVLENIRRLPEPVPYRHKSGAVTFVILESDVALKISKQLVAGDPSVVDKPGASTSSVRPEPALQVIVKNESTPPPATTPRDRLGPVFTFRPEIAQAHGHVLDDMRFLVLEGSTAMLHGSPNKKRDEQDRDALVRNGVLVPDNDKRKLRFTCDHIFSSSSKAAGVIKDGNASGPSLWKDLKTGRTLKDYLQSINRI